MPRDYHPDTALCERFADFRARDQAIVYAPNTSDGEEAVAFGVLFNLLHQQTTLLLLSPAEPDRFEPVYRDSLKYNLPIIRHTRLFTSRPPRNTRVYFIEDQQAAADFYACADVVLLGGTLTPVAISAPDLMTPILAGKPILAGPGASQHADVAAACAAGVIRTADSVEAMADALRELRRDREATATLCNRARAWLMTRAQTGASA